jgi:hypothetical protein
MDNRRRIVIESQRSQRSVRSTPQPRPRERVVAISLIFAAMLATFLALFITSRPYDPMNSTIAPQSDVPAGSLAMQPSPKPSLSPTPQAASTPQHPPEPAGGITAPPIDDATIQAQIEKAIAGDPALARLELDTIVEGGRVTISGSVPSAQLKQRVEKVVRSVKGVSSIDNQLAVLEATP